MIAREAARQEIMNITFRSKLDDMQMVARHAYALTFEKEHVEKWEKEFMNGLWGGLPRELEEDGEELREVLRPRLVGLRSERRETKLMRNLGQ
jgi:RNA-dependent RNA polymerase